MPQLDLNAVAGVAAIVGFILAFVAIAKLFERGLKALGVKFPAPTPASEALTEDLSHW